MMTRPITEQMTLWGQRFDQEINAHRRLRESLAEADMEVPDGAEIEYGQDMESLAHQAANIMSSAHLVLDELQDWMPTWDGSVEHLHQIMEALVGGATMDQVR
jgi:hypothetical protein